MALLGNLTGSSHLNFQDKTDFYNGVATQSLRWDFANTSYLNKTFGSAGSRQKFTYSCWVKIAKIENADGYALLSVYNSTNDDTGYFHVHITNGNLNIGGYNTNWRTGGIEFRDPSAWYNIIIAVDTTQGTANNRVRVYVNNQEITTLYSGISNMSQNANTPVGDACSHFIGRQQSVAGSQRSDGYMAECNMINNQQLTPSSFGEVKNGVWIPIDTSGLTFGTNGFRLQFDQVGVGTASASTIGADTSGNTNHFTSVNIVASDCAMPDSPENNFCTWNVLDAEGNANTFSEGNLKTLLAVQGSAEVSGATFAFNSGKWYWEEHMLASSGNASNVGVGIKSTIGFSDDYWMVRGNGGESNHNGSQATVSGLSWVTGDTVGIAVDMDAGTWTVSVNGTFISGNVHTGLSGTLTPFMFNSNSGDTHTFTTNFGQDSTFAGAISAGGNADGNGNGDFKYSVPSGYLALCTANLPEPTIGANSLTQADDHFNTAIYTGNGGTIDITVGFQPDFSWYKCRAGGINRWHYLFDSNRGANKALYSNLTGAEDSETPTYNTQSFQPDGTRIVRTNGDHLNNNGDTYVSWNWKGGTNVSNSDGSITSTVQANTDAGFSIVTYTASASSDVYTIGHGLSQAPELIINKDRDSAGAWWSFTTLIDGSVDYVRLDDTNAKADDTASLGVPTTSVFSQVENYTPASSNNVAYCFHSVEGYSKCGIYTGNGNVDGTFVYTGFRPAYIMFKTTTIISHWTIVDNARSTYNVVDDSLYADTSATELTTITDVDFLSNGFKWRGVLANETNVNGQVYIYMAFAEAPFKYANAR